MRSFKFVKWRFDLVPVAKSPRPSFELRIALVLGLGLGVESCRI